MDLNQTELFVLQLMSENGGEIPRDFFAKVMQGMVKKGVVEAHFKHAQQAHSSDYTYRIVQKRKGQD